MKKLPLWVLVALGLGGCATNDLVFITKTSISIVDFDPAASGVSVGYSRVEGYFGVGCANGSAPPVAAVISGDNEIFNAKTSTVFATGAAAVRAVVGTSAAKSDEKFSGDGKRMLFGTSTTLGMKVGFDGGQATSFVLGHRRREAAFIPGPSVGVDGCNKKEVPSVLAMLDSEAGAKAATAQLGLKQIFATGLAADHLADEFKPFFIEAKKKAAEKSSIKLQ